MANNGNRGRIFGRTSSHLEPSLNALGSIQGISTSNSTGNGLNNQKSSHNNNTINVVDVSDFEAAPFGTYTRSIANGRLQQELQQLEKQPISGVYISPREENIFRWTAVVEGPENTVYEGGTFFVDLKFTKDYPFQAPTITFQTRIYHCNINEKGRVCMDVLSSGWSSCKTISILLQSLISLLYTCNPHDALVPSIAQQFKKDPLEFQKMARIWTKRYAA